MPFYAAETIYASELDPERVARELHRLIDERDRLRETLRKIAKETHWVYSQKLAREALSRE